MQCHSKILVTCLTLQAQMNLQLNGKYYTRCGSSILKKIFLPGIEVNVHPTGKHHVHQLLSSMKVGSQFAKEHSFPLN